MAAQAVLCGAARSPQNHSGAMGLPQQPQHEVSHLGSSSHLEKSEGAVCRLYVMFWSHFSCELPLCGHRALWGELLMLWLDAEWSAAENTSSHTGPMWEEFSHPAKALKVMKCPCSVLSCNLIFFLHVEQKQDHKYGCQRRQWTWRRKLREVLAPMASIGVNTTQFLFCHILKWSM